MDTENNCLTFPSDKSKKLVYGIAEDLGFEDYKVEVSAGSAKGDNYLGQIFRCKIFGNKQSKTDEEEHFLILKTAPASDELRNFMPVNRFFTREIFCYTTMLPELNKIFEKANIEYSDRFHHPRYLKGFDDDTNEMLVLEDMSVLGYKMFDRLQPLDLAHVKLVVKQLAALHASSFALKEMDPVKYETISNRTCATMEFGDTFDSHLADAVRKTVSLLDDEDCVDRLRAYGRDISDKMSHLLSWDHNEEYMVLCHGDCWSNNMLFKYNESDVPVDLCILDWQIIRHASPVTDLAYFIFCCTDRPLRSLHLQGLLQMYYDTLTEKLKQMGQDAEKCFPEKVYRRHLQTYLLYGMVMCMIIVPFTQSQRGHTPDMMEVLKAAGMQEDQQPQLLQMTEKCVARIQDVIMDFRDYKMI